MKTYLFKAQPTSCMGSYGLTIKAMKKDEARTIALWHYNKARAHDGLQEIRILPPRSTLERAKEYVIEGLYEGGWEEVDAHPYTPEGRKTAQENLARYRENENGTEFRMRSKFC